VPSGGSTKEPSIRPVDAVELCATPYPTRREALAVARQLRAAGWIVVEQPERSGRRPATVHMVASVYHPVSYESPGDLLVSTPDP
jgi:hypothetical protein